MDLIHALRTLRRRWKWVAIGLLPVVYLALSTAYHVGPSGIHKKSLEYGAAQTQLLIDSPESTLASSGADVTPLSDRAQVFGQFFQTDTVKSEIASILRISPSSIAVTIPNTNPNLPALDVGQSVGQRNTGLLQESDALQLLVVPQPDLPMISLYAQGPTGGAAARLANAAATALTDYVGALKTFSPTPAEATRYAQLGIVPPSHVEVRQLGAAQGAMVDSGASRMIVLLALLGLLVVDCVLVVIIGGFVDRFRAAKKEAKPEFGPAHLDRLRPEADHSADFAVPAAVSGE